uniref:Protein FAR1-RELATED SEQUENCE n=1 Tax=Setaria viridis TaxID=4556 RepID=A0A4U6W9J3_SETVI|nr:hypothetical protein SEVIR_1G161700v2 [Setaria viridis]
MGYPITVGSRTGGDDSIITAGLALKPVVMMDTIIAEGFLKTEKENNQPQIEKTSKRVGYPAYAKVKEDKKGKQWYFDHVEEAHNHKLHPSPRMVRNAEQAREGRDGDLDKLFQFCRECKESTKYFYWDVNFDPKTKVLRSIFWSHTSQRAECKDFGDVIMFDTTHKTNSIFVGANYNPKNKESMDPELIPRKGMSFHSEAEAKQFFMGYAELAGFSMKMSNRKTFSRVMRCSCEGKGDYYKGDEALRVQNKMTMKMKCNAHLKFMRVYDSEGNEVDMVIEKANLFHIHLLQTPLKTKQMRSHKSTELILYQIFDELQAAGVSMQSIKNVLQNMHGVELVPITAWDIENR